MLFGTRLKVLWGLYFAFVLIRFSAAFSVHDKPSRIAYSSFRRHTNRGRQPASRGENTMTIDPVIVSPLIALIAGILILLMPRLLNYVVAIYLIAIGIIGL